jgi:hypothetical protein|tara:strand:- start:360 stop:1034 length:675 start_codon:yes stop_codon:yes gene_type:complete
MQTLEINHNDFKSGQEAEADAQLLVKFFLREKEDKSASAEEGRPIFKELEYVEIRAPGKRDAMACRPATLQDKRRFPRHYGAFKDRVEMPTEGTPLAEWPQMSRSMAEELSFLKVKTVEQLVSMSDNDAGQIRGGLALKQKAAEFLKYSDKTKLIAERQGLQDRLAEQDAQIAELKELILTSQSVKVAGNAKKAVASVEEPSAIDEDAPAPEPRGRRRQAKTED